MRPAPATVAGGGRTNKRDIAGRVAARLRLGKAEAEAAVDTVFGAIGESLAREEAVRIAGFGTFATRNREARVGRNPRTGESVTIAASKAPSFKAGKELRERVRRGPDEAAKDSDDEDGTQGRGRGKTRQELDVTAMVVTAMVTVVRMMVQRIVRGDGFTIESLGASLRDQATLPSPLRGLVPSGGYPSRLRSLRSLRTSFAKDRHRRAALPNTVPGFGRSGLAPALRAALAASRSASASGADARLVARPAAPVRASPVTGLHTAPRTCVRSCTGATADASGSVLRTTAAGAVRSARHSIAVTAPIRRLHRRRFPHRSSSNFRLSLRPAAVGFSHPTHR